MVARVIGFGMKKETMIRGQIAYGQHFVDNLNLFLNFILNFGIAM